MQQLSFTIPYTSSAIRATVVALNQMDNDLNGTVGLFSPAHAPVKLELSTPTPIVEQHVAFTPPPPAEPIDEEDSDDQAQPDGAVDSAGMVWDARIHSSSKAFLKSDGTWKLKKGVDKSIVVQVQAELMGNVPTDITPTQNNVSTPPPPVGPTIDLTVPATVPPVTVTSPTAETPSVASPFRQLLADITKAGLAPDYVQKTCQEVNGCTLPQAKDDVDKLAMLRMSLGL